ncbi:hypothetical protein [Halovenus marina]|uniref:DUF5789 family protein n=1 Tax=Halovenus marina TaxID=3396621 RepID=UPI003F57FFEC
MADDKRGRDKQAHDEDRRQRERELLMEMERADETEPPVEVAELDAFETKLDAVTFPATGEEIVTAVGDYELDSDDGTHRVEALIPATDSEAFDSPAAVRVRIQRPTVAAAMKRVVEASDQLPRATFGTSQREAYEKTFRALKAIDADDDDEGIAVVADWIVEQIQNTETLPGSRAVRRRAAKFCRSNDFQIRDDEWLGI